ncbi:MAG: DUF4342 domain-containing protein [Balneolaceae bacterium]
MTTKQRTITEEIRGTVEEIISQIRKLIREGNARRVIIKNREGKILFQSPLTIGLAGTALFALIAPVISAITVLVLYTRDVKVLVEREVDENEDEYEVDAEAEVVDISDEGETDETHEEEKSKDKSDKTVGKK